MQLVYPFTLEVFPELAQVGGKAMSLIHMSRRGLPVPPGIVLSVDFFQPWLDTLQKSIEWKLVLDGGAERRKQNCEDLKALAMRLEMDDLRKDALAEAVNTLKGGGECCFFAVRSSSPEEDLETLSFAGGYETVLGLRADQVEVAVRRSFASCLDERVFVYKQEHGLDVTRPRIAVIVQRQVAAEKAGVGFSLNPLNNCYDEAVINANFGLGESVVSGMVTPDTFVIDKASGDILERKLGNKETSVWLGPDGGTYQEPAPDRAQFCLTNGELLVLTDMLAEVEAYYRKPMDIEWAFADGNLYLLQARPITVYFYLPEALRTAPGAPRQLYWDLTLTKWGMPEPLSVMGTDYIAIANTEMLELTLGISDEDAVFAVRPTLEGRTYVNASNSLKMQGQKRVASELRTMDTTAAAIIENLEENLYVPDKLPPTLRGLVFKVLGNSLGMIWKGIQSLRHPKDYERQYLAAVEKQLLDLEGEVETTLSLGRFAEHVINRVIVDMEIVLAIIFAAEIAKMRIKGLFKKDAPEVHDLVASLERSLPNNVTIEMGLAMVRLAQYREIGACDSGEEFTNKLKAGDFTPEFTQAWERFMQQYGFRCPMEMDPSTTRPYEQPGHLFEQLRTLALNPDPVQNPEALYERGLAERQQAYTQLLEIARQKGKRQARVFEKNYQIMVALAGFRETPKYCFVLATDMFRRQALKLGHRLVQSGRLDTLRQLFDLHIDDIERALVDPSTDLRALAVENTRYLQRYRMAPEFPRIVDSRGKILRSPRKAVREGELVGDPIAPGVVRGPAKVLHTSDEKPVLPGDILVARATDPGWTPLFINAAGVILEVGGLLQHGALVAREYGKPCVTGIEGVTGILKDGQMVEMDGTNGIIRLT